MSESLTDYLRQVGEEKITICFDGNPITCTRTEAAARKLFLMAHGGIEETIDETGGVIRIFHKGDPKLCKMIREYTEGRPNIEPPPEQDKNKKPGQFNSQIGKRLMERLAPEVPKQQTPKRPKIKKGKPCT